MAYAPRSLIATVLISVALLAWLPGCDKSGPVAPSPEQRRAELILKADKGDAESQYLVGKTYDEADGVPEDDAKAVEYYQKAAAQSHSAAQYVLGLKYRSGSGVVKDAKKAFALIQKASEAQLADATATLGSMYALGEGVATDEAKAVELLNKSVEQGSTKGMRALAAAYEYGVGVKEDMPKAVSLYEMAAGKGDVASNRTLGDIYNPAVKDRGVGLKDVVKARKWYESAAEKNDVESAYVLGGIYYQGEGVPEDWTTAAHWYLVAACEGHVQAQVAMGVASARGSGVPRDLVLAYAWLNLAIAGGGTEWVGLREELRNQMDATQITEAQRISAGWRKGLALSRGGTGTVPGAPGGGLQMLGTGTAFFVSESGEAVTNYHVIRVCGTVKLQGQSGIVTVVSSDQQNDLALLKVAGYKGPAANLIAEPSKIRQGDEIVAFGYPLNSVLSSGGNLTPGVVSALTGLGNNASQIQITAPIQPGSSGSPVMNKKGEVIAVVVMKLDDMAMAKATGTLGQTVNFAVGGQTLKTFLDAGKVDYPTGRMFSFEKSSADLAEDAKKWTTVVECWQ